VLSRTEGNSRNDNHHHRHKHPGLDQLASSVSRVTVALSIVSSVSQLYSFFVGCSGIILKGFGFVAFFVGGNSRNDNNGSKFSRFLAKQNFYMSLALSC
jgi:hypothetical protein